MARAGNRAPGNVCPLWIQGMRSPGGLRVCSGSPPSPDPSRFLHLGAEGNGVRGEERGLTLGGNLMWPVVVGGPPWRLRQRADLGSGTGPS